jgi:hypothetical protein
MADLMAQSDVEVAVTSVPVLVGDDSSRRATDDGANGPRDERARRAANDRAAS